ncbi:AGE family epimerase/isomerase, partial [Rhizobium sp.]|uniref:AGE family epimerase/isomerase n=1 Tax=Rhizobium sp. TaxID=391 RepID=UPI000E9C763D|nr:N-acylglucosamine 2-epimerase [Rhizobium sp.]
TRWRKWVQQAYDAPSGQFIECLQLDGSPDPNQTVRTRTAARLIYVYAHASALGVAPAGSLTMAEQAFANLHRSAWKNSPRPGYARTFHRTTGLVIDPVRDLYDNACVVLALSWLLSATGKRHYAEKIDATINAIDATLKDPFSGWAEDSLGTLPRRQNPHMHYFEAQLALCEQHPSIAHSKMEKAIFALFRTHLFGACHGPLRENFGPRWEIDDLYGSGRLEPGHMCEWVWLIRRYGALTNMTHDALCDDLLTTALTIGRSEGSLFLQDQVTANGTPLLPSRRLWSQVEMLKALLSQHRALGQDRYRQDAEALASAMFATYFRSVPEGCWHDMLDGQDRPIAKTIPASSLYHLWTLVADLMV